MIEETAVRVEIHAARFASQSIFDILRLTVQAMQGAAMGSNRWQPQPAESAAGICGRERQGLCALSSGSLTNIRWIFCDKRQGQRAYVPMVQGAGRGS